jgi:drug/metabolite transporter (DMT)-like permease
MRLRFTRLDAWLLLMTFFWGSNFSVLKAALRELPGPGLNGIRMVLASLLFLAVIAWREGLWRSLRAVSRDDWPALIGLSLIGHGFYQALFLGGVARTSVANSALIFGCTPVTVSLLGAFLGHERPGWTRWVGTALSLAGIYFVVGHGAREGSSSPIGDLLILLAMVSWSIYTVGTRPLLDRYSPVFVTGLTMTIGTVVYAPIALTWLKGVDLSSVSTLAWLGIFYSAAFSLVAAYIIWYTAVHRLGGGHTAIYSNVVPLVAMAIATLALGEPTTPAKLAGTAAVLCGVAFTRLDPRRSYPASEG